MFENVRNVYDIFNFMVSAMHLRLCCPQMFQHSSCSATFATFRAFLAPKANASYLQRTSQKVAVVLKSKASEGSEGVVLLVLSCHHLLITSHDTPQREISL